MKIHYRQSFVKDLDVLDPAQRARIEKTIRAIELSATLRELRQLKKLQGRSGFFRIRVGDYRLGAVVSSSEITLVRCLDRKEFYRHFP
jgi:mRNA interferase RelE/StbE